MENKTCKTITPFLAFKKKDKHSDFISKLICWFTNSEIYHVELALENRWISATPGKGIYVNELRPLENDWEYYYLRPITISEDTLKDLLEFIDSLNGSEYNTMGIFWNHVIGLRTHNEKYFCSELAAELLMFLGYKEFFSSPYYPSDYSPSDMLEYLKDPKIEIKKYTLLKRFKNVLTMKFLRRK